MSLASETKKAQQLERGETFSFRLTRPEREILDEAAGLRGLRAGAYVRAAALERARKDVRALADGR